MAEDNVGENGSVCQGWGKRAGELVVAEIENAEPGQRRKSGGDMAGEEVLAEGEEAEAAAASEAVGNGTSDTTRDQGELGQSRQTAKCRVQPASQTRRAGAGIAEGERHHAAAIAEDARELTWVSGEVPRGEEVRAGHVLQLLAHRLKLQEVRRVKYRHRRRCHAQQNQDKTPQKQEAALRLHGQRCDRFAVRPCEGSGLIERACESVSSGEGREVINCAGNGREDLGEKGRCLLYRVE